jgi:nucleoside-diphosphate-sugar epimerase
MGAARNGRDSVFNIGSAQETLIADLAQLVFDITGHHPQVEQKPALAGSVARRVPDIGRLAALGFEQSIPLEAGIRSCW